MPSTVQQVTELGNTVARLADRVKVLEKDSAFVTEMASANEDKRLIQKERADETITSLRTTTEQLDTTLKNVRIALDTVIGKLRESVRQQDLKSIQERVDQWGLADFATKRDLKEYTDY